MITPEFPYKGNQLILSSDRVLLHSKNDAIFLFGKAAVSLCSTQTINLDAKEKILIDCNKIELGNKAEENGEPVVLGKKLNEELIILLSALSQAGKELQNANTSNMGFSMISIHSAGLKISGACNRLSELLSQASSGGLPGSNSLILSKNTFTR